MNKEPAILVLEDGRFFEGFSFGAEGETFGEVVFNTSMSGYQEILTDPSYHEQIITMTYPHIGNYGINSADVESTKIHASGFIVKEASAVHSNWRSDGSLHDYLKKNNVVSIEGIDTRALVKHIRTAGAMRGAISTKDLDSKSLLKKIQQWPSLVGRDLVKEVTCKARYSGQYVGATPRGCPLSSGRAQGPAPTMTPRHRDSFNVAVYDFGVKTNILNCLKEVGCSLTVLPASAGYQEVLKGGFDGLFLSNGPGDPAAVDYAIKNIRHLLGKLPIFGICLGHQILALALGAKTYKLKFGHRGANQPVKNLATGKVEITSQNHGFAVEANDDWLEAMKNQGVTLTHINLNDDTVEGISVPNLKAFSVQYHPESSPGPHDSRYLFNQFVELMKANAETY